MMYVCMYVYDTSYLQRTKTCTVYFYLLFIYAARVYSYLAGKKIGHQFLTVSRFQWIFELAAKCLV